MLKTKVKRLENTKNWVSECQDRAHGRACWTHDLADQVRTNRTVRTCPRTVVRDWQVQKLDFSSFHHFARKIQSVNPFSMLFSPMRSSHLALSYSTEEFKFQLSKNSFPEPHIITYFKKRLNVDFSPKNPVFSQTTRLTYP